MKRNNDGSSLVEIVAATAIMGVLVGAVCTSLMFGLRLNEKTDAQLQAQMAVSSAVETLMAVGIDPEQVGEDNSYPAGEDVQVVVTAATKDTNIDGSPTTIPLHYYKVEVNATGTDVKVTTHIREAVTEP